VSDPPPEFTCSSIAVTPFGAKKKDPRMNQKCSLDRFFHIPLITFSCSESSKSPLNQKCRQYHQLGHTFLFANKLIKCISLFVLVTGQFYNVGTNVILGG
jgi:hypothetical protein